MASFIFPMWKVISSLVYILFRIKHSTNSIQLMLFNQKTQLRTLKGGCTLQIKGAHTLLCYFLIFRLVGCNIILMKHFLPLFILTGLLFGQDGFRVEFIESKDSSKRFIICAGACVGIIWLTYYIFFEHSMM